MCTSYMYQIHVSSALPTNSGKTRSLVIYLLFTKLSRDKPAYSLSCCIQDNVNRTAAGYCPGNVIKVTISLSSMYCLVQKTG